MLVPVGNYRTDEIQLMALNSPLDSGKAIASIPEIPGSNPVVLSITANQSFSSEQNERIILAFASRTYFCEDYRLFLQNFFQFSKVWSKPVWPFAVDEAGLTTSVCKT